MEGRHNRIKVTVAKGEGWHEYIEGPPPLGLIPVGKARLGDDLEGALVLDVRRARYVLIDKAGTRHDLDYTSVRDALYGKPPTE